MLQLGCRFYHQGTQTLSPRQSSIQRHSLAQVRKDVCDGFHVDVEVHDFVPFVASKQVAM